MTVTWVLLGFCWAGLIHQFVVKWPSEQRRIDQLLDDLEAQYPTK